MKRLTKAEISAKQKGHIKNPIKENMEKMEAQLDFAAKMNMLDARLSRNNVAILLESGKLNNDIRKIADAYTLQRRATEQEEFNYEFIINKPKKININERIAKFTLYNEYFLAASNALANISKDYPKDREVFGLHAYSETNALGEGNGYLLHPHTYVDTSVTLNDNGLKKKFRRNVSMLSLPEAEKKLTKEFTGDKRITEKILRALAKDGSCIGNEVIERNFQQYHEKQLENKDKHEKSAKLTITKKDKAETDRSLLI